MAAYSTRDEILSGMRTALQWRVEFWDRLYGLVIGMPDRSAC